MLEHTAAAAAAVAAAAAAAAAAEAARAAQVQPQHVHGHRQHAVGIRLAQAVEPLLVSEETVREDGPEEGALDGNKIRALQCAPACPEFTSSGRSRISVVRLSCGKRGAVRVRSGIIVFLNHNSR